MFLYEPIRDAVLDATTVESEKDAKPKLWQMILAGGLAGALGTYITSPTDLIKIRMQSGVKYDGVIDAFVSVRDQTRNAAGPYINATRHGTVITAAEITAADGRALPRDTLSRERRFPRRAAFSHYGMAGRPTCSDRSL